MIRHLAGRSSRNQDVTARYINLTIQRQRHTLLWQCLGQRLIKQNHLFDKGLLTTGQDLHRVPGGDASSGHGTGEPAEVRMGSIHPLNRHAKARLIIVYSNFHGFQKAQQRGPRIPCCAARPLDHIVALQR